MANIMSNHSISKMNMAAFEKETVVLENLRDNISLLNGGTCSFQYKFQIEHGILQKDFLMNRLIVAS